MFIESCLCIPYTIEIITWIKQQPVDIVGCGGVGVCLSKKICWVSLLRQIIEVFIWNSNFWSWSWGRSFGALNNIFLFSILLNTKWSLLYWINFKGYVHNDTFAYDICIRSVSSKKVRGHGVYSLPPPPHNLNSLAPPPLTFIYLDVTLTTTLPQLEFIGTHFFILILFIWMFLHHRITIFGLTPPPST